MHPGCLGGVPPEVTVATLGGEQVALGESTDTHWPFLSAGVWGPLRPECLALLHGVGLAVRKHLEPDPLDEG